MNTQEHNVVELLYEALEQLVACHDEPTCPAITVAGTALDAAKQLEVSEGVHELTTKRKLLQIHDALCSLSDTDPDTGDMDDDEIREYHPVFWAAKEIAALIGDAPWDRYTTSANNYT